jgi:hypothetical protein
VPVDPTELITEGQALGIRADAVAAVREKLAQRLGQATWSGAGASRFRFNAERLDRRILENADGLRRLMTSFQRLADALEEELRALKRIEERVRTWLVLNPTVPPPWPPNALPPTGDPAWREVERAFAAAGLVLPEPDAAALARASAAAVPSAVTYPGDFGQWLDEAQRIAGFSDNVKAALHNLGMQESGGRNIPQGIHDINTDLGTPAFGPLQVIEPTFNAYAWDGHTDWKNPVHNILAAYKYAMARYGKIPEQSGY